MTDFYIRTKSNLADYTCDQTIIVQKKYLKNLSRVKYVEETCGCSPQFTDWYPFTNSYYPHTEDVDAFSRVNHLLGSNPSLTTLRNCDYGYDSGDSYSENGAQQLYLSSPPVSFVIWGKPGIGEEEVGKLLAEYWRCVYIDPETLIREEINANTRTGLCIEFNMRCGRAIGTDIIIRLLEKRLESKSAKHRGFVICGFPLIPNDLYEEDPISSETAVFSVNEIFDEILETTLEIGVPQEEELPSKTSLAEIPGEYEEVEGLSKPLLLEMVVKSSDQDVDIGSAITENICASGTFESNIEDQVNFIFSQLSKPFIVVYVKCSNADAISKHKATRFDAHSKQLIDLQREHSDKVVYTYFSRVSGTNDELPEDFIDIIKNANTSIENSSSRLLVNLPNDFPANISSVLERYRYSALPAIEKHILMHDAQYFIKVDGRISPVRMFSAIKTKLSTLPLQKVILPEKLLRSSDEGEGSPMEALDSDELNLQECFQRFQAKDVPSFSFKWGWSDWGTKCPVSMKEGNYKDGDPKFAVHFLNKIFFLTDEDAYMKFYRNPRPYLLPPYPKRSCKVIVMGPNCSGKTAVSKCLGYLLKGKVIDFNQFEMECFKKKSLEIEDEIRQTATQEAISKLNSMRREEFDAKEIEREANVQLWLARQSELLKRTIDHKEYFIEEEQEKEEGDVSLVLEMSSFPVMLSYNKRNRSLLLASHTSLSSELQLEIDKVKDTVAELQQLINFDGLPGFHEMELCEDLLNNPDKLLNYLPPNLLPPSTYEPEPANENDEFVKEFADDAVRNASFSNLELAQSAIAEMLIEAIKEIEYGNNKGGWIIDGIHPNHELLDFIKECPPDDIIMLRDLDEYEFLLQRFETKRRNNFQDFRKFFMKLGKPEVAWRCFSLESTTSYKLQAIQSIIGEIIDESQNFVESKENNNIEEKDYFSLHPRRAAVEAYKNSLYKFDEDRGNIQSLLSEFKLILTEVIVTNKSLEQLLEEIVYDIESRYKQAAAVFTPEDRAQELVDFGETDLQGEEMGEGDEKGELENTFLQNRRFGDTFNYCPVTFSKHWVLWKGKEEYTAKYENKVYLMCSEEAMTAFVEQPRKYLLVNSPPQSYPPPRICVVGPSGSGKTSVTNWLCKNLGLYNAAYDKLLKEAIAPKSAFELKEVLEMEIAGVLGEIVNKYLTLDEPLPEEFLNGLILPFWFEEPAKNFGFAFDGYPKRASDVNYITQHSVIPDVVIELSITEGDLYQRLVTKLIRKWEDPNFNEKETNERKHNEIMLAWKEKRNLRFCELLEARKKDRLEAKIKDIEDISVRDKPPRPYLEDLTEAEDEGELVNDIDSADEEADSQVVLEILAEELPEPIFEDSNVESVEEILERLYKELEESYIIEQDFIRVIRQQCEAELIPWATVDAGMSKEKVFAQVMRVVEKYKFRNNSLFERVYDISVELADKLLSVGYYFLSRFGKTCPVQIYDNVNSVQMFLPLQQKSLLFPVIHRQYIYFLAKKNNRDRFKDDPLMYTTQSSTGFPLIPFKLAIIGPPKSGKTELAERFKRDLGMKVISGGQAGRYVLKYLEFSELAKSMESILKSGEELTSEMLAKCVEALSFEGRGITQGFVLDGFPNCSDDVRFLAGLGLVPQLVIDLQADQTDIHDFLSTDSGKKGLPVFSKQFIDLRYGEFLVNKEEFREWLDKKYQTLANVPVKSSKWGVWTASFALATFVLSEIRSYYEFAHFDVVLKLANMQVTPLEFIERQSVYKHYCPCCLHFENVLNSGGDPPDRNGLLQFKKFYYYVCNDHIENFINDPEQYLPPQNHNTLPPDFPLQLHIVSLPENIHEEGLCIICYWDNIPKNELIEGRIQHAVLYKEKVYLFDTAECLRKFMRQPEKYCAILIRYKTKPDFLLSYKELPMQGLLQQYDSKLLFKAVVNTSILRPVIPGLSPSTSAAINTGLHLKLKNPKTPEEFRPLYQEASNLFHERRTKLIDYLAQKKKVINPYIYYEETLPKLVDPYYELHDQASGYSSTMFTDTRGSGDEDDVPFRI